MSRYRFRASWTTRGLGQTAAVVEVDDGAVEGEGLLDLTPIVLVVGQPRRRLAVDGAGTRRSSRLMPSSRNAAAAGAARRRGRVEKPASREHERLAPQTGYPARVRILLVPVPVPIFCLSPRSPVRSPEPRIAGGVRYNPPVLARGCIFQRGAHAVEKEE